MERIDALLAEARGFAAAYRMNHAMWAPKALDEARAAHERRLREGPCAARDASDGRTVRDLSHSERMEAARELFAGFQRPAPTPTEA